MLNPSTGMCRGRCYRIESPISGLLIDGFFLDGKFFASDLHESPAGWLEGNAFVFNAAAEAGQAERSHCIAGEIHNLVLTLANGMTLGIREVGNG